MRNAAPRSLSPSEYAARIGNLQRAVVATQSNSPWNPRLDAKLEQLWMNGLPTAKIGDAMGMTKSAIVGRAHRLHLPKRDSPIKPRPGTVVKKPGPRRMRVATLPPLVTEAVAMPPTIFSEWGGNHREIAFGNGNRSPVRGLTLTSIQEAVAETPLPTTHTRPAGGCQWPGWPHGARPTHQYCDAPSTLRADGKRSSYCGLHLKKSRAQTHVFSEGALQAKRAAMETAAAANPIHKTAALLRAAEAA